MLWNIIKEDNAHVVNPMEGILNASAINGLKARVMDAVSDNKSVVISFERVESADKEVFDYLKKLHEELYEQYHLSFVICCMSSTLIDESLSELNLTPTLVEALDIVNMEVIERELLG